jgi:WD40 repeat protein
MGCIEMGFVSLNGITNGLIIPGMVERTEVAGGKLRWSPYRDTFPCHLTKSTTICAWLIGSCRFPGIHIKQVLDCFDDLNPMSDSLYTRLLTLRTDKGPIGTVRCLAFSPSGVHLASGGDDNLLIVWELERGSPVCILQTDSPILSLVWDSGDNGKLFIGDENGSVVLLDISVSDLMFVYSWIWELRTGTRHGNKIRYERTCSPYFSNGTSVCNGILPKNAMPCHGSWWRTPHF